jgi:aquaporin related protein
MQFSNLSANLSEDMAAALLELIGTAFFLIIGLGGIQAATAENLSSAHPASNIQQVLYISTSMGFSLLVSAWLFFRITGGLFNPNVSLALLLVGAIKPVRFMLYCIAQLLGAIAGSAILRGLTSKSLSVKFVIGL